MFPLLQKFLSCPFAVNTLSHPLSSLPGYHCSEIYHYRSVLPDLELINGILQIGSLLQHNIFEIPSCCSRIRSFHHIVAEPCSTIYTDHSSFLKKIEYNCFTMWCQVLLYNEVNQLYVSICPSASSWTHTHIPPL